MTTLSDAPFQDLSVAVKRRLIEHVGEAIEDHAEELTRLDKAIGDGDHGINMSRGVRAVSAETEQLVQLDTSRILQRIGMILVMNIGGAAGPIFGTFFLSLAKGLEKNPEPAFFPQIFEASVESVCARGKSRPGQKTVIDVLAPLSDLLLSGKPLSLAAFSEAASAATKATIPLQAQRGRASFLGARSIGHMDPGARSAELMIRAVCSVLAKECQ